MRINILEAKPTGSRNDVRFSHRAHSSVLDSRRLKFILVVPMLIAGKLIEREAERLRSFGEIGRCRVHSGGLGEDAVEVEDCSIEIAPIEGDRHLAGHCWLCAHGRLANTLCERHAR